MKKICMLLFTFVMVFGFSISVYAFPITGLVGKWTFDGNADDTSGNGNNGTVSGATLANDRFGNANSAYSFNGMGDYIRILNSPDWNIGTNNYSLSLWFSSEDTSIERNIISQGDQDFFSDSSWIFKTNSDGRLFFVATDGAGWDISVNSAPIVTNVWNHAVMVRSGSDAFMYINGVEVSHDITAGANIQSVSSDLIFGARELVGGGLDRFYKGLLDDINAYDRALSASEVQELFSAEPIPEPATIALLGIGLVGLAGAAVRRRLRQKAKDRR